MILNEKSVVKSMAVRIKAVEQGSPAAKKRITEGCELISINCHEITDVLDYRFYLNEPLLAVCFKAPDGKTHIAKIEKDSGEDIGLEFETYLMDKQRRCKNKCVFCFIDQLPQGLRQSLYFKDDDSRLSFLFGNYITLTNTDEREIQRIIDMHISPVNVSVHTMNPDLRVKMMGNPSAGTSLGFLKKLASAGIKLNTQLVLCPGINDESELEFSLAELAKLYPAVLSIAAVPVGLTAHRQSLTKLKAYDKQSARRVIDTINSFNASFEREHGEKIAYAADEFYLKAELAIPGEEYYDGFPQLENGVGMWALTKAEFERESDKSKLSLIEKRTVTIVTGEAAFPLMRQLGSSAQKKLKGLTVNVIAVKNKLFGGGVTVAGLLSGRDIADSIKDVPLGDALLIPACALRHGEDVFLDDFTLAQLRQLAKVSVAPVSNDGGELFRRIAGV